MLSTFVQVWYGSFVPVCVGYRSNVYVCVSPVYTQAYVRSGFVSGFCKGVVSLPSPLRGLDFWFQSLCVGNFCLIVNNVVSCHDMEDTLFGN